MGQPPCGMATRSTVTISAASLEIGIAAGLGIGKVAFSPEPTPDAFMVQCVTPCVKGLGNRHDI